MDGSVLTEGMLVGKTVMLGKKDTLGASVGKKVGTEVDGLSVGWVGRSDGDVLGGGDGRIG